MLNGDGEKVIDPSTPPNDSDASGGTVNGLRAVVLDPNDPNEDESNDGTEPAPNDSVSLEASGSRLDGAR